MLNNARPALADNSLFGCVLSSNPTSVFSNQLSVFAAMSILPRVCSARLGETLRQHWHEDNGVTVCRLR
jgi:hypothetical protein